VIAAGDGAHETRYPSCSVETGFVSLLCYAHPGPRRETAIPMELPPVLGLIAVAILVAAEPVRS